jgi:hypothetical protein
MTGKSEIRGSHSKETVGWKHGARDVNPVDSLTPVGSRTSLRRVAETISTIMEEPDTSVGMAKVIK